MNSIRVVLSVAAEYVTEQLDMDTAFLDSNIEERVFMEVPYGILSAWHKTIHRVFMKIGFRGCGSDVCVYVKANEGSFEFICLYVDDMIIAAKTSEETQDVKSALKRAFKVKGLGEAKFIIGMEINHDYSLNTVTIKQTRYIDDVVEMFNQKNANMVVNPCESGLKLTTTQSAITREERIKTQVKPYRSLIGYLLYITTCTRSDSRFLENPGIHDWMSAIRVLRYLKDTRKFGVVYKGKSGKVKLTAYTDAEWGSNLDDRRSVSGTMVKISGVPVAFKSKY
ncbi:polyprotein [Phytophthora palmivora]|uniref:Polyprotein n=1 Tax=Phytophthora palmivora TaxID=4796 RepID=A0A2P4X5D2_9STRA|nr:polyprotein [Phytophthora palmivora]